MASNEALRERPALGELGVEEAVAEVALRVPVTCSDAAVSSQPRLRESRHHEKYSAANSAPYPARAFGSNRSIAGRGRKRRSARNEDELVLALWDPRPLKLFLFPEKTLRK